MKQEKWKLLCAKNAVYVENITAVNGEEEIIFPSGSEFIVKDVNEHKILKNLFGVDRLTEVDITIPLYIKDI